MTKYQIFETGAGAQSKAIITKALSMIPHEREEFDGETVAYFWADCGIDEIRRVCAVFTGMNGQIELIGAAGVRGTQGYKPTY